MACGVDLQPVDYLFVHSPLVGPKTWEAVACRASQVGDVAVPDLRAAAQAVPQAGVAFVAATVVAADALGENVAVVGHSGAGAFLPQVGRNLGKRLNGLVFVDAVVPPARGVHTTSAEMLEFLDGLGDDLLPRWSDWWGRRRMKEMVPSRRLRRRLIAEMPMLSRDFYDEAVPVPDHWTDGRCAYIKLSAAYDAEYVVAGERDWPIRAFDGTHLSLVTEPELVFDAIAGVLEDLRRT